MKPVITTDNQEHTPAATGPLSQPEPSPYQPEVIETGRGAVPGLIRYLPHAIILWSAGYVLYQTESTLINYITTILLLLWAAYSWLAVKKNWPPLP